MAKKLNPKVAQALMDLMKNCDVTTEDFDERAVEMLAGFSADQGSYIIRELLVRKTSLYAKNGTGF